MTLVYFATNRAADASRPNGYGAGIVDDDPNAVTYAVADVPNPASGQIAQISDKNPGRFSDAATAAIVGADRNLFVFIHGFDNSFEDAITRAATNADFYRQSQDPDADTVCIAFTWPSMGELIDLHLGDLDDAYERDQAMAGASALHLGHFFNEIDRLRVLFGEQKPLGKIFLLAHSMGNWALQAALSWWTQNNQPKDVMFDEVILAAADEVADTFEAPGGHRMSRIADLARRVTIYYSGKDAILQLSAVINRNQRLGQDGPADKDSQGKYPPTLFRIIDCTAVGDFFPPFLSLETHQYYRLSDTVRKDIVAVMTGSAQPPGGLGQLP